MSYMLCPECGEANGIVNTTVFQCRCARERQAKPALATPAATPMAVDPSAGDRLMATARTALAEQLYVAADKCNIRIVPFDERGVERVAWNADWNRFADAVAMNSEAPQKLPAAAQPQRESEQPEQALREALDGWIEAHQRLDHSGITDCTRCKRIAEIRSGFKLAALSPQTDSQEQR